MKTFNRTELRKGELYMDDCDRVLLCLDNSNSRLATFERYSFNEKTGAYEPSGKVCTLDVEQVARLLTV